jgi:hypothetical protein
MTPGFRFRETMSGTYHLLSAPLDEKSMSFTISAEADDVRRFARDKTWRIEGEVDVEGFAERRPLEGTLAFRLLDQRRLPYRFTFLGDDGNGYEFRGQKDWTVVAPLESMTVLPGAIYDAHGTEIARATLRFDARNDLWRWLRSFRVKL